MTMADKSERTGAQPAGADQPAITPDSVRDALAERLAIQVDRVRASDILGRSDPLHRLFDYLAGRAHSGETPKEFEIAQEALGKGGSFDVAQDASIRVYIHRLRKKLDEFYAATPEGEDRLSVPRGTYRLVLHRVDTAPPAEPAPPLPATAPPPPAPPPPRGGWTRRIGLGVVAMVALGLATGAGYVWSSMAVYPSALARTAVWAPIAGAGAETSIAVGNQPLPGGHPHVASMGSVLALTRVLPVFNALTAHPSAVPAIANVSFLSPTLLKERNLVFIGTLDQLGLLSDPVFGRSGFTAEPGNVLVDRASGRRFVSSPPPFIEHRQLVSYGYLASFTGPAGRHMVVISGATDGALLQMAEIVSDPAQVDALAARAGPQFEALFAVSTFDSVNVSSRLELVRPMRR
jgi:hypothetical protein